MTRTGFQRERKLQQEEKTAFRKDGQAGPAGSEGTGGTMAGMEWHGWAGCFGVTGTWVLHVATGAGVPEGGVVMGGSPGEERILNG